MFENENCREQIIPYCTKILTTGFYLSVHSYHNIRLNSNVCQLKFVYLSILTTTYVWPLKFVYLSIPTTTTAYVWPLKFVYLSILNTTYVWQLKSAYLSIPTTTYVWQLKFVYLSIRTTTYIWQLKFVYLFTLTVSHRLSDNWSLQTVWLMSKACESVHTYHTVCLTNGVCYIYSFLPNLVIDN
jgi:hypothetical protein